MCKRNYGRQGKAGFVKRVAKVTRQAELEHLKNIHFLFLFPFASVSLIYLVGQKTEKIIRRRKMAMGHNFMVDSVYCVCTDIFSDGSKKRRWKTNFEKPGRIIQDSYLSFCFSEQIIEFIPSNERRAKQPRVTFLR